MNLISKLGLDGKLGKNFLGVMIVAFAGSIIYGLPYFRYDYYDVYLETYNLTNTQMGLFGTILGVFGMVSYLFGGVVVDKFSTRTILTVSLIGTGIGGFIHLLPLGFGALVCLYAFWGISSLFAFWPACVKAVRILSGEDEQGKAYGFFEGGRGIAAALMATAAVLFFRLGCGQMDDQVKGMRYVIIFYSVLTIAMGIFAWLTVKEDIVSSSDRITLKGIGEVLKMPAVWIIGIVTFCTYVFTLSLYYFTPYLTDILGATVTFGAALAASKRWFSLLGNVGGGYITDRFGASKIIFTSFLIMAIGTGAILLLPVSASSVWPVAIIFVIIYIFYNVNYAMTWTMMEQGAVPKKYSGTAAGIISTVGYLPEIFVSLLAGTILDNNPGVSGYRVFFGFLIVVMIIGAIFVLVWNAFLKKHGIDPNKKPSESGAEE